MQFHSIIEQWQHYGRYFGYPKCCVESFCYQTRTRSQSHAGDGSGFIPCKHHAKMINSGEITLNDLITKRQHSRPFKK